ncbi:glyoxylase-like metal-dependent hydrolase (beta-lactamase superfamily II) [Actinoplanes tereljensis]|uniref:MBL fold hydrolase n=1 Tax=Paractinoplanes tereljensis TaxID=571912 RepID=A0A919NNU6_9ACTN|nr:MBL fold metallo-hydrolase [Actinoplanes tereljensis]GIF21525.1 MBL fold hydrolase [Actinoplanes tereljensis]
MITGSAQAEAWRRRVLPPIEEPRPGVWSIPVPIPHNPMRYTICYAFPDDGGLIVVDPGWDSDEARAALTAGLAAAGASVADVRGIVVTHVHPDHHGMSGWLRGGSGAWIGMHPAEAATLPVRAWRGQHPGTDPEWLGRHGVPPDEVDLLGVRPERMAALLEMPEPDREINDGDLLPLAGRSIRAVWTPGHTPGHLCLHDAAAGVLLTGDHLLPRISPNVAVLPTSEGDPLGDYLGSLARMSEFPDDEALPAHEYRFRGIDARATALIEHHDERAAEILAAVASLDAPTGWAVAAELTWSRGWDALHGMLRRMALAETLAHLHHLESIGVLKCLPGTPALWQKI